LILTTHYVTHLDQKIGKETWKEKTGEDWPHLGWWGRATSLDPDIFYVVKTNGCIENT